MDMASIPTWGFLTAVVAFGSSLAGAAYARGKTEGHGAAAASNTAEELAACKRLVSEVRQELIDLVGTTDGKIRTDLAHMAEQLTEVSDRVEHLELHNKLEAARKEGAQTALAASDSQVSMRSRSSTKTYRSGK